MGWLSVQVNTYLSLREHSIWWLKIDLCKTSFFTDMKVDSLLSIWKTWQSEAAFRWKSKCLVGNKNRLRKLGKSWVFTYKDLSKVQSSWFVFSTLAFSVFTSLVIASKLSPIVRSESSNTLRKNKSYSKVVDLQVGEFCLRPLWRK